MCVRACACDCEPGNMSGSKEENLIFCAYVAIFPFLLSPAECAARWYACVLAIISVAKAEATAFATAAVLSLLALVSCFGRFSHKS